MTLTLDESLMGERTPTALEPEVLTSYSNPPIPQSTTQRLGTTLSSGILSTYKSAFPEIFSMTVDDDRTHVCDGPSDVEIENRDLEFDGIRVHVKPREELLTSGLMRIANAILALRLDRTPVQARIAFDSVQMTSADGEAGGAHKRAIDLRDWFECTIVDVASAVNLSSSTIFNWANATSSKPRQSSIARLDEFWVLSRAVQTRLGEDGFRTWAKSPLSDDRLPRELFLAGDLHGFRKAIRPILRPRRPVSEKPARTTLGAWSPELDG